MEKQLKQNQILGLESYHIYTYKSIHYNHFSDKSIQFYKFSSKRLSKQKSDLECKRNFKESFWNFFRHVTDNDAIISTYILFTQIFLRVYECTIFSRSHASSFFFLAPLPWLEHLIESLHKLFVGCSYCLSNHLQSYGISVFSALTWKVWVSTNRFR